MNLREIPSLIRIRPVKTKKQGYMEIWKGWIDKADRYYLSEPWLLTLPGSRGGPGPRCARAWGPQGAASFPAAAGSWHPLPPIRGPSRRSPVIPARLPTSTWSCPSAVLRLPRSIRTSVALQFRKTHQSRHRHLLPSKLLLPSLSIS